MDILDKGKDITGFSLSKHLKIVLEGEQWNGYHVERENVGFKGGVAEKQRYKNKRDW